MLIPVAGFLDLTQLDMKKSDQNVWRMGVLLGRVFIPSSIIFN
jgi:hypothetical protein